MKQKVLRLNMSKIHFDIDIYDWIDNPIPDENISSGRT